MSKQITSMTRLTGQLERMFKSLNESFYDGQLDMPIITVTPTARAYAHYTPWNAWESKGEHKREINISSAYLDRPLEYICGSLLHEMAHMYNDTVLEVSDTSIARCLSKLLKVTALSAPELKNTDGVTPVPSCPTNSLIGCCSTMNLEKSNCAAPSPA